MFDSAGRVGILRRFFCDLQATRLNPGRQAFDRHKRFLRSIPLRWIGARRRLAYTSMTYCASVRALSQAWCNVKALSTTPLRLIWPTN
jgi:hypothetical protein